jgi:type IV pilus assembly protein PilC
MPGLQLLAALFVVGGFIWLIGTILPPEFHDMVDVFGIGVGNIGLRNYLLILGTIGISGGILAKLLLDGRFGTKPYELMLRVPVIGECLRTLALSRMSWALALSNDAGMSARRTMALSLRATQAGYYMAATKAVDQDIIAGKEMHEALRGTNKFTAEFLETLEAGEMTGQIPETLLRLSDQYRQRAEVLSQTIAQVASFVVWAMVAIIIIICIFKIAMIYIGALNDAAAGVM